MQCRRRGRRLPVWNGLQFNYPSSGQATGRQRAGSLKPNRNTVVDVRTFKRKRSAHKASATNQLNLYPKDTKYSMHCILDVPANRTGFYFCYWWVLCFFFFLLFFVYFYRASASATARGRRSSWQIQIRSGTVADTRYTNSGEPRAFDVCLLLKTCGSRSCLWNRLLMLPHTGNASYFVALRLSAGLVVCAQYFCMFLNSVAVRLLANTGLPWLARKRAAFEMRNGKLNCWWGKCSRAKELVKHLIEQHITLYCKSWIELFLMQHFFS